MNNETAKEWVGIEHANSISRIPESQFPNRACRIDLMFRALDGEEIYAYTPFGSDQYILWVDDGSGIHDCRWKPTEYGEQWDKEHQP